MSELADTAVTEHIGDTPGCSLRYHGCTNPDVTLTEDSYEADVHDNPGQFIWACRHCRSELALDI